MSATPEAVARWLAEREELWARVRRQVEERRAAGRPAPPRPPEVPCRLAGVSEVQGAALALQRAVQRAGGYVQATYARGWPVGRGEVRDSIAIRCWGPDGRRVVACWTRPDGGKWTCTLRMAWGAGVAFRKISDVEMKSEVASWGEVRYGVATHVHEDEGVQMANRLADDVQLVLGGTRQYTKVPWQRYADGTKWQLDRGVDWPSNGAALNVLKSARKFAEAHGYILKEDKDDNWVRVQFISHKVLERAYTSGGTLEHIAAHYGLTVEDVSRAIEAERKPQAPAASPVINSFAQASVG